MYLNFSAFLITLIDFVRPMSTNTVWSACEKTIKTKKNKQYSWVYYAAQKNRKIQKSKNSGSDCIVRKRKVRFAPRIRTKFGFVDFFLKRK